MYINNESSKINESGNRQGFFIEAGACDGETLSNSLYFEVSISYVSIVLQHLIHYRPFYPLQYKNIRFQILYNFTGLLVEPNPDFLDHLKLKRRNAWILPHCLSVSQYK